MQTFFSFDDLPCRAEHIVSFGPNDDPIDEEWVERIGHMAEAAKVEQEDGTVSYFVLQPTMVYPSTVLDGFQ